MDKIIFLKGNDRYTIIELNNNRYLILHELKDLNNIFSQTINKENRDLLHRKLINLGYNIFYDNSLVSWNINNNDWYIIKNYIYKKNF